MRHLLHRLLGLLRELVSIPIRAAHAIVETLSRPFRRRRGPRP